MPDIRDRSELKSTPEGCPRIYMEHNTYPSEASTGLPYSLEPDPLLTVCGLFICAVFPAVCGLVSALYELFMTDGVACRLSCSRFPACTGSGARAIRCSK